ERLRRPRHRRGRGARRGRAPLALPRPRPRRQRARGRARGVRHGTGDDGGPERPVRPHQRRVAGRDGTERRGGGQHAMTALPNIYPRTYVALRWALRLPARALRAAWRWLTSPGIPQAALVLAFAALLSYEEVERTADA